EPLHNRPTRPAAAAAPPQPAPDLAALADLQASVRDLAARVTDSSTAIPPPPPRVAAPSFPPSAQTGPGPKPAPKPRGPPPPATESATGYDFDTPCYDTSTSRWYGNPAAFAIKNPRSWEPQHYREGTSP